MPDDDFYSCRQSKPAGVGRSLVLHAAHRPCPVFLPAEYQPKYPYPWVLLLHPHGSDVWETFARVPHLSNRNYIVLCPRGSRKIAVNSYGQIQWGWAEEGPADIHYLQNLLQIARQRWNTPTPRLYVIGVGHAAVVAERFVASCDQAVAGLALLHPTPEDVHKDRLARCVPWGIQLFLGAELQPRLSRSTLRCLASRYRHKGASVHQETYSSGSSWYLTGLRRVNRWIMDTMPTTFTLMSPPTAFAGEPPTTLSDGSIQ